MHRIHRRQWLLQIGSMPIHANKLLSQRAGRAGKNSGRQWLARKRRNRARGLNLFTHRRQLRDDALCEGEREREYRVGGEVINQDSLIKEGSDNSSMFQHWDGMRCDLWLLQLTSTFSAVLSGLAFVL